MKDSNNRTKIIVALIAFAGIVAPFACNHFWKENKEQAGGKKQPYFIAGTVIDEFSNKGVGMAEITIIGRNEHYYTEENGNFKIILKDSVFSVRVRAVKEHYRPYDKTFDVPNETIIIPLIQDTHN